MIFPQLRGLMLIQVRLFWSGGLKTSNSTNFDVFVKKHTKINQLLSIYMWVIIHRPFILINKTSGNIKLPHSVLFIITINVFEIRYSFSYKSCVTHVFSYCYRHIILSCTYIYIVLIENKYNKKIDKSVLFCPIKYNYNQALMYWSIGVEQKKNNIKLNCVKHMFYVCSEKKIDRHVFIIIFCVFYVCVAY